MTLELAPTPMVPVVGLVGQAAVQAVLWNIEAFDHARFEVWRKGRGGGVDVLANQRPPDRLYRVVTDNEREGETVAPVLGVVLGYQPRDRGAPAMCLVHILGVAAGAGSYEAPIPVPGDGLEDVTERARAGRLGV